jgi:hypothetical protein
MRRLHLPLDGKAQSILDEPGALAGVIARGSAAAAPQMVSRRLPRTLSAIDAPRALARPGAAARLRRPDEGRLRGR